MVERRDDAAGRAALSICESLLLTLLDKGVLKPEEVLDALEDAAAAHRGSGASPQHLAGQDADAGQIIETQINNLHAMTPRRDPSRGA